MTELTRKQKNFCREFVIDFNGTQAAIRAGYSKKTARNMASNLLTKLNIQKEIQKLTDKITEKQEIDAEYVLNTLKEVVEIGTGKKAVEQKVYNSMTNNTNTIEQSEINLSAVNKSLELLGRYLNMFEKDNSSRGQAISVNIVNDLDGD